MRTTIELPDHLRAAVLAVAARRGYRGYSRVVAEALEWYLREKAVREDGIQEVLDLAGTWTAEDAAEVRVEISEVRNNWRSGFEP